MYAKGKIVVIAEDWLGSYGKTVVYRSRAAVEVARVGGLAALIRSVTPFSIYSPHTGMMSYSDNVTKIPAAALTVEDAQMLLRMSKRGNDGKEDKVKVAMLLHCIGDEGMEIYNTFKQDEADTFKKVIKLYDAYFNPKKNVVYCRANCSAYGKLVGNVDLRTIMPLVVMEQIKINQNLRKPFMNRTMEREDMEDIFIGALFQEDVSREVQFKEEVSREVQSKAEVSREVQSKADVSREVNSLEKKVEVLSWMQNVKINDQNVSFKLDSGAQCNVLPLHVLNQLKLPKVRLEPNNSRILSYDNQELSCLGNIVLDSEIDGDPLRISLYMEAQTLANTTSRNTVAELQGTTHPEKVVVVSGHLDSWDVGQGAMDDGGGAFISWGALALLKSLGLKPRRTIRAVLWTAEEVGLIGAEAYKIAHANETDNFIAMMESDEGTFTPFGLEYMGSDEGGCIIKEILKLMEPINATQFKNSSDVGSDITVWANEVPLLSNLNDNGRYFWFHHSNGDTMTVLSPDDLDKNTALWAATAYILADISVDLPKPAGTKT
ncbi:hypothetical protein J6590_059555 [Homalodisca vitripennis]|nr:hypothetical protein J6590_059555 [Homalodisca vitripennis]